jgi:hypothetical protein
MKSYYTLLVMSLENFRFPVDSVNDLEFDHDLNVTSNDGVHGLGEESSP